MKPQLRMARSRFLVRCGMLNKCEALLRAISHRAGDSAQSALETYELAVLVQICCLSAAAPQLAEERSSAGVLAGLLSQTATCCKVQLILLERMQAVMAAKAAAGGTVAGAVQGDRDEALAQGSAGSSSTSINSSATTIQLPLTLPDHLCVLMELSPQLYYMQCIERFCSCSHVNPSTTATLQMCSVFLLLPTLIQLAKQHIRTAPILPSNYEAYVELLMTVHIMNSRGEAHICAAAGTVQLMHQLLCALQLPAPSPDCCIRVMCALSVALHSGAGSPDWQREAARWRLLEEYARCLKVLSTHDVSQPDFTEILGLLKQTAQAEGMSAVSSTLEKVTPALSQGDVLASMQQIGREFEKSGQVRARQFPTPDRGPSLHLGALPADRQNQSR